MAREQTELISIRIPRRVSSRLSAMSKKRGVSVSAIVREALEEVVEGRAQSAWEAGAHLWGKARGRYPKDLSTNKRHLNDLGNK